MSSEESRRVELNGELIVYRLRRSARRSIGLRIDGSGLLLSVPLRAGERDIQAALQQRAVWILQHLQQYAARAQSCQPLAHGRQVLFLGQPHVLHLSAGRRQVEHYPGELHVRLPDAASEGLPRLLQQWYRQQALRHFSERVQLYASRLAVLPPLVQLTSARTRWGSCNHRGEIRLHWRLMQAAPALIDYVIAHELAHIHELNHSPRFWAHVERAFPNWRQARQQLKDEGHLFWQW